MGKEQFHREVYAYLKSLEKDAANCRANASMSYDSGVVRMSKNRAEAIEFVVRAVKERLDYEKVSDRT